MFETLTIKNFQCHKSSNLNFVGGLNVIAGTSDSGKSAVLKALAWLLTNKPQGIGFRHYDCSKGDTVAVTLKFDGHTLSRERSEKENRYVLDGQEFVAMKTDVPVEIAEVLNLSALNIQTQFQPHYLLSATSGEIARTLNEVCDLSIIDKSIKEVNSRLSATNQSLKGTAAELESCQEQIKGFDWLLETEAALKTCEGLWNDLEDLEDQRDRIGRAKASLIEVERQIEAGAFARKIRLITSALPDLEQDSGLYSEKCAEYAALKKLTARLSDEEKKIAALPVIDVAAVADLDSEAADLRVLEQDYAKLDDLAEKLNKLSKAKDKVQGQLETTVAALEEIWAKNPECPLCGAVKGR